MKKFALACTPFALAFGFATSSVRADDKPAVPGVAAEKVEKAGEKAGEKAKEAGKEAAEKAKEGAEKAKEQGKDAAEKAGKGAEAVLLDINTATEDQLKALPAIGDKFAAKIVAGRPYEKKDQLVSKKVLPKGVYKKVKDLLIAKQQ